MVALKVPSCSSAVASQSYSLQVQNLWRRFPGCGTSSFKPGTILFHVTLPWTYIFTTSPMSSGLKLTVDSTLGAASVGFFISSVVFGVLTSQAFTYFRRYPLDKPAYKVLVSRIELCSTLELILTVWRLPLFGEHELSIHLCFSLPDLRGLELVDQIFVGYAVYVYVVTYVASILTAHVEINRRYAGTSKILYFW